MKYPTATFTQRGVTITADIYDLADALGINSHPLFNALKKLIRRGNGAKTEEQDLREAIQSIERHLRGMEETSTTTTQP